ncbi:MAG: SDR family oxidoreductase [Gammaproteobacteria bacterium]
MNVVITGANRGIGLEFVRYYLNQGEAVWACHRADAAELQAIQTNQLKLVTWDVTQEPMPETVALFPQKVDLLINNAGIYGPSYEQSLDNITAQDMHAVFDVNCVGSLRAVQTLMERVIRAKGIIANISSKMGSSDDNSSGGCYAYRAAKAAMIIVSKSMAIDLGKKNVRVITLHPGWVKTDMTNQTGEIDAQTSVAGMSAVIHNIDHYQPGEFVAWDGEHIPF